MKTSVFITLLSLISTTYAACDQWPNGTDTEFHWWQCNDGPITYLSAKLFDETATKEEYPIHLSRPLTVRCEVVNPTSLYGSPDLRLNIYLWSWNKMKGHCDWFPVPTLGLLSNLDACKHGIKCPLAVGQTTMDVLVDFTKFKAIVSLLKDDAPYQMQYELYDRRTGDKSCFMGQARARVK